MIRTHSSPFGKLPQKDRKGRIVFGFRKKPIVKAPRKLFNHLFRYVREALRSMRSLNGL